MREAIANDLGMPQGERSWECIVAVTESTWKDGSPFLRNLVSELLIALRELHDYADPIKTKNHKDRSEQAFADAIDLLRKYET